MLNSCCIAQNRAAQTESAALMEAEMWKSKKVWKLRVWQPITLEWKTLPTLWTFAEINELFLKSGGDTIVAVFAPEEKRNWWQGWNWW
jgi:hypothetical protein